MVKNCSLPHCRSKCEDSNGLYLTFVSVTVSPPIVFKAVSVLGVGMGDNEFLLSRLSTGMLAKVGKSTYPAIQ